jgi:hypothetical protein
MFKIIQTVHHNDGKDPVRTCYNWCDNVYAAMEYCHTLNEANADKNQREDSIPVTYSIEYQC